MRILAVLLLIFSIHSHADTFDNTFNQIETEWADIHYRLPSEQKASAYQRLLTKTEILAKQYPNTAGLLFWQAVVKASLADHQDPVSALQAIFHVKELLNQAIALDPSAFNGSAYVVLGVLYHEAPPSPIAFGDDDAAESYLKKALSINPEGLETNYYYGNFLADQDQAEQALSYLKKAINAPIRPEQVFSDTQMQNEAKLALKKLAP